MRCNWQDRVSKGNFVVTLTYEDNFLSFTSQGNATLNYSDFQRFMKRLRKMYPFKDIRYICRGEYGGQLGRPHFHVCLFGLEFTNVNEAGFVLSDLWPYGGCMVDVYSGRAIRYITKYIIDPVKDGYISTDEEMVKPIFTASKRPSIGYNFFNSLTYERCERINEYAYLDEDDIIVPLPQLFVKKADTRVCGPDDNLENHFKHVARKDERREKFKLDNVIFTSPNGQVNRAEYIAQNNRKKYIKSKSK